MASNAAVDYVDVEPIITDFAKMLTKQLQAQGKQIDQAIAKPMAEAGEVGGKAFSASLGKTLKANAGKAALAGGALVGTALVAGVAEAINVDAANDKLAAQLGLTQQESERIGGVAGDLYANAYGDSIQGVNDAVKSVIQNIDGMQEASSADLEDITAKALDLTTAFDVDLNGATAAAGQLMRTGLAANATEAFDILTRGFQTGADRGQDLVDTFTEYPALFERLGLAGDQAMGLISQGLEAGARNSDLVADALKEFQIRATDASETSAKGFELIGLNAEEMTAKIAAGGVGAQEGLDQVLDGLRNMEDPVARNAAAVALFGTQAEDLGDALFSLDPSEAVAALGQVTGASEAMGETLNDNAQTNITAFGRTIKTGLVDFLGDTVIPAISGAAKWISTNFGPAFSNVVDIVKTNVLPALQDFWRFIEENILPALQDIANFIMENVVPALATLAGWVGGILGEAFKTWGTFISENIGWLKPLAGIILGIVVAVKAWHVAQLLLNAAMKANPIGIVITIIGALVTAVIWLTQNFDTFKAVVSAVWEKVLGVIQGVWNWIKTNWPTLLAILTGPIGLAVLAITKHWDTIKAAVVAVFGGIKDFISGVWNGIAGVTRNVWNGIKRVTSTVWNGIRSFITTVANGIRTVVTKIWNGIKNVTQTVFGGIRSFLRSTFAFLKALFTGDWGAMRRIVLGAVNGIRDFLYNIWNAIRRRVGGIVGSLRDSVLRIFRSMRDGVAAVFTWIKTKVFDRFVGAIGLVSARVAKIARGIRGIFKTMRDAVGDAFGKLVDKVKGPVRTVVKWINKHIIRNINKVTGVFGLDVPTISENFNKGGVTPEVVPGGGPNRDNVLGMIAGKKAVGLTGGEGIISRKRTTQLGGRRGIAAINQGDFSAFGGAFDFIGDAWDAVKDIGAQVGGWLKQGAAFALEKILSPALSALKGVIPGPPMAKDFIGGVMDSVGPKIIAWGKGKDETTDGGPGKGTGRIGKNGWALPVGNPYRVGVPIRGYPGHTGQDLPAPGGTPVYAAMTGIVRKVQRLTRSYGKNVLIDHMNGWMTRYAHLSAIFTKVGSLVSTGFNIGRVGSTGNSTGNHLHFEMIRNGGFVDPRNYIKFDQSSGGVLPRGWSHVYNGTGGPERMRPADSVGGGAPLHVNVNAGWVANPRELESMLVRVLTSLAKQGRLPATVTGRA